MTTKFSVVLTLFVACLVPGSTWAAALIFDDTSPNDVVVVGANDFEFGLSLNGAPFQGGLNNPASATLQEAAGAVSFSGQWIDLGQSQPGFRTIYLVEPNAPTSISDILEYQVSTDGFMGTITGRFISDYNDNLGSLPVGVSPKDVFIEDAGPVPFGAAYLGGEIRSDVPEPGTLALAVGLGLVALKRRR